MSFDIRKEARAEAEKRVRESPSPDGPEADREYVSGFVNGVHWADARKVEVPVSPCDGGCNYNSGPEETCSAHGRPVAEVWEIVQQIGIERDRYRAAIEDVMELVGGSKARRILGAALGGEQE